MNTMDEVYVLFGGEIEYVEEIIDNIIEGCRSRLHVKDI